MTRRRRATDRLERLLALIPWVAARPGGVPVEEVCARFQIDRAELLADIDTVMMTGVHPFTPDTMIEAWVDDDLVTIHYADEFSRPLRLTPHEALALVTAARGVARIPGREEDGPLQRAIAKLDTVLESGPDTGVQVDLGRAGGEVFGVLEAALDSRTGVRIDYPDLDEATVRTRLVEPSRVFSADGRWYVAAWCHHAGAPRVFRVDRILAARPTEEPFSGHDAPSGPAGIDFDRSLPQVTVQVDRDAAWLLDRVPVLERHDDADGIRVRLAVASARWLARFLLRLGPAGRVLEADPSLELADTTTREAQRILARYR